MSDFTGTPSFLRADGHFDSPVWFVYCRPLPHESWNYISPSLVPGKHLLWDRNGCRCSLKPVCTMRQCCCFSLHIYTHLRLHLQAPTNTDDLFIYVFIYVWSCMSLLVYAQKAHERDWMGFCQLFEAALQSLFGRVPNLMQILQEAAQRSQAWRLTETFNQSQITQRKLNRGRLMIPRDWSVFFVVCKSHQCAHQLENLSKEKEANYFRKCRD